MLGAGGLWGIMGDYGVAQLSTSQSAPAGSPTCTIDNDWRGAAVAATAYAPSPADRRSAACCAATLSARFAVSCSALRGFNAAADMWPLQGERDGDGRAWSGYGAVSEMGEGFTVWCFAPRNHVWVVCCG